MSRTSLTALALCGALASSGCGFEGACEGTGGVIDECKEGWTAAECAEWDDQGVNGSTWTYHAGQSCEARGYAVECADGSWVKSAGTCG